MTLKSADFIKNNKIWTLHINRADKLGTITERYIVLAISASGSIPKMPQLLN